MDYAQEAFRITWYGDDNKPNGREIVIYANGTITGLEGNATIFNKIPLLMKAAYVEGMSAEIPLEERGFGT